MARYTLVYGIRLVPEGTLVDAKEARLTLSDGESAGLTSTRSTARFHNCVAHRTEAWMRSSTFCRA